MSVLTKPKSPQCAADPILKARGMTLIIHLWNNVVRHWQRRKMIAALNGLDDRILLDIGVPRGEIESFVDGLSSAELWMAPIAPESLPVTKDLSHADLRRAA